MTHVVMFSGGLASWYTARRVSETMTGKVILLFADTKMEDPSLYTFLRAAADDVGGRLVSVCEGRTPWEIFFDEKFLGNTRIDPCSKILKRQLLRRWLNDNCRPESTVVHLGFDFTEAHRFERAKSYWGPWQVDAPLCRPPIRGRNQMRAESEAAGLPIPDLYKHGFPHNNCGGFCVKAGQAQFRLLLLKYPGRYKFHEQKEQELRSYLGKDVAILRDRRGGKSKPMTMAAFRGRIEKDAADCDLFEWGGCNCFMPPDEERPEPVVVEMNE